MLITIDFVDLIFLGMGAVALFALLVCLIFGSIGTAIEEWRVKKSGRDYNKRTD